jgi:transcriptional regulator with XRE-family HTH domain
MPTANMQLRRERQLRGWSQAYLARQIDVPDYYISRWERGGVLLSPYYQQKLCMLFGKTAEELGMLQGKDKGSAKKEREVRSDPLAVSDTSPGWSNAAGMAKNELVERPVQRSEAVSLPREVPSEQPPLPSVPPPLHAPDAPTTMPMQAVHSPFTKTSKRPWQEWKSLALLTLMFAVLIGGGWALVFSHSQPRISATASVVGHLKFLASGRVSDTSNQGIADKVRFDLHPLPAPSAGKSYYAWLLPDEEHSENTHFLLGKVTISGGSGHLSYDDPQHTNLLAITSSVLVTEEAAAVTPLFPSTDKSDWRYFAQIPNLVPSGDMYSYLDHLRHLLAEDPTLKAHHLAGGLTIWLFRNTQTLNMWTLRARDEWQANGVPNISSVRRYAFSILNDLDGASYVQQDLPGAILPPRLGDEQLGSIGLLQLHALQDPPSYLYHVTLHLNGLASSPGATPFLREHTARIITAMNTVNEWLQQVHRDAKQLVAMTDDQLRQQQAATLLNEMVTNANNALFGKKDPRVGDVQEGVEWISQNIESLATIDIMPYSG